MHIKVNGIQAIEARIARPLSGEWSAEFSLDSDSTVDEGTTALITIADTMEFVGTVTPRTGQSHGRINLRVVGGNNALGNYVEGKSYWKPTVGVILKDILFEAGETLSSTIDGSLYATRLGHWCRANNPARRELKLILATLGLNWRVLPSGDFWIGTDDWPDGIISEYLIEEEDNLAGRVVIAADIPTISPGEVFVDKFVQTVVHMLDKNKLRTELVFV